MDLQQITPEFITLYDLKLAAGRLLSDKRGEDSVINSPDAQNDGHNILINEAAARHLGFTVPGAIGKTIRQGQDFKNGLRIVGVLRDAGFRGARKPVQPAMFI